MKRYLIGSLVGGILLFAWQSIAHMGMHHHDAAYKMVPNENAVMAALNSSITAEGQYLLPGMNPNASEEEQQKYNEAVANKPWAIITYHPAYNMNMTTNILRGFCNAILCALLFIIIIGKNSGRFMPILLKAIGFGFFAFMYVWYNQNIWMQTPWDVLQGELIDHFIAWALCGAWLGWWLPKTNYKS